MAYKCPDCSEEFYDRLKYCPKCGFDFTAAQKRCPKCREQIPKGDPVCPECGLDFEKYAYLIPRLVVFGSLIIIIFTLVISPFIWKSVPLLHDKAKISDGHLRSDLQGQAMVPLFIDWRSGERYIKTSLAQAGLDYDLSYMDQLIPIPPEVVFHYNLPMGEKVWIIRWRKSKEGNRWAQIGRWGARQDKYGWVHESNLNIETDK